jgi:hypothetical protein
MKRFEVREQVSYIGFAIGVENRYATSPESNFAAGIMDTIGSPLLASCQT